MTDVRVCKKEGCTAAVHLPDARMPMWRDYCKEHGLELQREGRARGTASGGDRAPRARKRAGSKEGADAAPKGRRPGPLAGRIETALVTVGTGVYIVNQDDGRIVIAGAHNLAVALDQLARENPKVRAILEKALAGGAWGGVIMASAAIVVPIAANHGWVKPIPFVPPPTVSPAPDMDSPPNTHAQNGNGGNASASAFST